MKVEIWSDVVCPWCYIGKRHFEAALDGFEGELDVVWRSFELDPSASATPQGDLAQELATKYRVSVEEAREMMDRTTRAAAKVGLEFDFHQARRGNTLDAHRLIHLAGEHRLQGEMKERLLRGYFTEGKAISSRDELAAMAGEVGLDSREVARMLETEDYVDDVRADEMRARELGIRGVPFFLLDGWAAISGAQPSELFREGLERVLATSGSDREA